MDKVYIFGHQNPDTDTIASAIALADFKQQTGYNNYIATRLGEISRETSFVLNYFKIKEPELLTDASEKQVVLVDHNERKQSAKGIENANILEIIDHHRVADIETQKPLYITIEPLGSTASIIYKKYEQNNVKISKSVGGLLLSALLSDTLILTSPTTTEEDREIAESLAHIAGVDIKTYGNEMLREGASLEGYSTDDIFGQDRKRFEFGTTAAYVGQVFTFDVDYVINQKLELIKSMQNYIDKNDATLGILAITDLSTNDSTMYACGSDIGIAQKAFDFTGDQVFLKGVVSRKSQIVPPLTEAAK